MISRWYCDNILYIMDMTEVGPRTFNGCAYKTLTIYIGMQLNECLSRWHPQPGLIDEIHPLRTSLEPFAPRLYLRSINPVNCGTSSLVGPCHISPNQCSYQYCGSILIPVHADLTHGHTIK